MGCFGLRELRNERHKTCAREALRRAPPESGHHPVSPAAEDC
jgi:hypothetical protein